LKEEKKDTTDGGVEVFENATTSTKYNQNQIVHVKIYLQC
jgi:hypothetical protein